MSTRQKFKAINDIFEMISENDDDIKFDECGILKPVTLSKSTIVVVYDKFHLIFSLAISVFLFSPMTTILIRRHLNQHPPAIVIVCTHSNQNRKQKCDFRNI